MIKAAAELRRADIEHLAPTKVSVADFGRRYEFLLPVASTLDKALLETKVADLVMQRASGVKARDLAYIGLRIRLVSDARAALTHARASVVASGTATVEAALAGNPFVVVYRVSPLTYIFGRHFVSVADYAMANLI